MTDATPARSLTAAELQHLDAHGYVIAKGILTQGDFAAFEADYSALIEVKAQELLALGAIAELHVDAPFDRRLALIAAECRAADAADGSETDWIKGHIEPFGLALDTMYARQKGLFELFFSPRLLACIASVVGPEVTLNPIQHCRPFLPANAKGEQLRTGAATLAPWHQDQGVTREEADESNILTVWIPLTDVEKETGCLELIPGQKKKGLLNHVKSHHGTTIDPAQLPSEDEAPRFHAAMEKGDMLLMHKFTPHRSQPNYTDKVRWSLDLRFQKTGEPTGRHFWPEFILQSEAEPAKVQSDYAEWCARWISDLKSSEGERWHRVAGDVGGNLPDGYSTATGAQQAISAK